VVREPLRWCLESGQRAAPEEVLPVLRQAALGACASDWSPPSWLLPHQVTAARRLVARLQIFRGAMLADAVGLGKTYVALAVATRYHSAAVLVPAALVPQWKRVMRDLGLHADLVSHEALSRHTAVPAADLIIVDEAHRFRNADTRRYDRLARACVAHHLLLLTATPVVNRAADVVNLARLFLPDHGLALHGVSSLAQALAARDVDALAHACSAWTVARSPAAVRGLMPPLPDVQDAEVVSPPPLDPRVLEAIAQALAGLQFPSFGDRQAAELLRLHLWYRLASSAAAFRQSLRRHTTYLDRAIAAATRGEALSRSAARALWGEEHELQLELECLDPGMNRLDPAALVAERERIQQMRATLDSAAPEDPKADALDALLQARCGAKTLVFTSAVATAGHLARRQGWRRVCTVTARGARIASGPINPERALTLFAPQARAGTPPPPTLRLDTLIATDLLSEGLNLQDADAVIHYDLPWTTLRLEQRLGRIARLGSRHGRVRVWWFRPCDTLEGHLALASRLGAKAGSQLRLGVPASGSVGRARIQGGLFDWRETFGAPAADVPDTPRFAVVRAPAAALLALRWTVGSWTFPELMVLAGHPPAVVAHEGSIRDWAIRLAAAPASPAPPAPAFADALHLAVRTRLASALHGPRDDNTRHLARGVLRLGALAARSRQPVWLGLLDQALDRLAGGVALGALRALHDLVGTRPGPAALRRWLHRTPPRPGGCPVVALEAAVLGDGTLTGHR
jgi:superfamily II DNA or RNA helicase